MVFPSLPSNRAWSADVYNAIHVLQHIYSGASQALSQGGLDRHRITFHEQRIEETVLGILEGLNNSSQSEGIPKAWVEECTGAFIVLIGQLEQGRQASQGRYVLISLYSSIII